MTGDGAVVRDIAERWVHLANVSEPPSGTKAAEAVVLARAYLEREAEIERLKIERHAFAVELKATTNAFIKADDAKRASEARTADLLKALERIRVEARRGLSQKFDWPVRACVAIEAIAAEAAKGDIGIPISAAKGETV